jgi:predicted phage gp36 major capsid-like protein
MTNASSANPLRQISKVIPITTDDWNGVSTAGITASWDGEAGEVSDDAPTVVQPSIKTWKAQAFVPFSIEVGADWVGMESDLFATGNNRPSGQRGLYCYWRVGAGCVDTGAFGTLNVT